MEISSQLGIGSREIEKELLAGLSVSDHEASKGGGTVAAAAFMVNIDGASRGNPGPASAGVVILTPAGKELHFGKNLGIKTNNEAEYGALIMALQQLKKMNAGEAVIRSDSKLLINQMLGNYKVKHPKLRKLFLEIIRMRSEFNALTFVHIPRNENKKADILANDYLELDNK